MAHGRNCEISRKGIDEIRQILFRRKLIDKVSTEEPDTEPIECVTCEKDSRSINIVEPRSRIQIILLGETAHVRMVS